MRYILAFLMCLSLTGCATNPFSGILRPPSEPRKIANYLQSEKQVPLKVGITPDGKDVIAYATERTYVANSSETPEKLSFIQRLGRWIGSLSLLAALFIMASIAFFGGAPILWAVKKYYTVKNALKNTVAAIDNIDPADFEKIKPKLAAEQDTTDKKLIAKLKAEI